MDDVNPGAFRAAIIEAWHSRDMSARRRALDQLIDEIRLVTTRG